MDVDATKTQVLSLNGYVYEVDTCESCDAEVHGAFMAIADWGRLKREPRVLDKIAPPRTTVTPQAMPKPPAPKEEPRELMPQVAERWRPSEHARQRMAERGFNLYDVLMTCERPEYTRPHLDDPDRELRKRGRCVVVVEPEFFRVVTVLTADEFQAEQAPTAKGA